MRTKTFFTVIDLAKAVPMNTPVVRFWAKADGGYRWQLSVVEFNKVVSHLKANYDAVCADYEAHLRAQKSGKPMTKATLEVGAVCVVPRRFSIPEHRGKRATLFYLGPKSYCAHRSRSMTIQFEDGVECRCTTDDIAPLHFSMP